MPAVFNVQNMETVKKDWGEEKIFVNAEGYCGKMLVYQPGWRSSKHYHVEKDETMCAIGGKVFVEIWENGITEDPTMLVMTPSNGVYVRFRPGVAHRLSTPYGTIGLVVEWSTTHREEDVVRLEPSQRLEIKTISEGSLLVQ